MVEGKLESNQCPLGTVDRCETFGWVTIGSELNNLIALGSMSTWA